MEQRLLGRIAIVTGAGRGIGKGIALRLAREGTDVVVAEYDHQTADATAREIFALGRKAMAYPVDISDVAAVRRMVDETVARFDHIDILVNAAGVQQIKPMLDITEGDWDRVIDINQRGTFFVIQAVVQQIVRQLPPALRDAPPPSAHSNPTEEAQRKSVQAHDPDLRTSYGKIVNLSSVSGRVGRSLQAHYAASKAAIISMTQSAAFALAPYRINVNAVCPGIVPTAMWRQIDEERIQLFGDKSGAAAAAMIEAVPLKRAGTPDDIAGAIAYFCSPDADYVTGQTLNVDGGYRLP